MSKTTNKKRQADKSWQDETKKGACHRRQHTKKKRNKTQPNQSNQTTHRHAREELPPIKLAGTDVQSHPHSSPESGHTHPERSQKHRHPRHRHHLLIFIVIVATITITVTVMAVLYRVGSVKHPLLLSLIHI